MNNINEQLDATIILLIFESVQHVSGNLLPIFRSVRLWFTTMWCIVLMLYSKTCLKRNAIVPVLFFRFHRFPFHKGLCFNKTKYKKYDRLGLQRRNNLK